MFIFIIIKSIRSKKRTNIEEILKKNDKSEERKTKHVLYMYKTCSYHVRKLFERRKKKCRKTIISH